MDNLGDLFYILLFVVFIVVAIARKIAEQKDVTDRQKDMRRRKPEDLPEATRRMLYGDDVPTARPRTHGAGSERTAAPASRREPQIPTAHPRQGQPRRVVPPPPVAPRQTTARPVPPPQVRPVPPMQRAPAPPRERPVQEHTPFRPHEDQRRLAPEQRREAPPMRQQQQRRRTHYRETPPPIAAPVQQESRRQAPRGPSIPPAPTPRRLRHARQAGPRFFADRGDVRRAIIMSEILGPPKAFE